MRIFFFLMTIVMLLSLSGLVSANNLVILEESNHSYLVLNSDTPLKVSAFEITLHYGNETLIQDINGSAPFTEVSNIQNLQNTAKVVGYVSDPSVKYEATSSNLIAEIIYTGKNEFTVSVDTLEDFDRQTIQVDNFVESVVPVTQTETLQPYNLKPSYSVPSGNNLGEFVPASGSLNRDSQSGTYGQSTLSDPGNSSVSGLTTPSRQQGLQSGVAVSASDGSSALSYNKENTTLSQTLNTGKKRSTPLSIQIIIISLVFSLGIFYKVRKNRWQS